MSKFLQITIGLSLLIFACSIAYYFLYSLPKSNANKNIIAEEKVRIENLNVEQEQKRAEDEQKFKNKADCERRANIRIADLPNSVLLNSYISPADNCIINFEGNIEDVRILGFINLDIDDRITFTENCEDYYKFIGETEMTDKLRSDCEQQKSASSAKSVGHWRRG